MYYCQSMADFKTLSEKIDDTDLKKVFSIVAGRQSDSQITLDSVNPIPMTADDTLEIQAIMLEKIREGMALDGGFQTLDEAKLSQARMVSDSFFNPMNRIGTEADPAFYNQASIPISMSPNETTAYYASGGIPARIIDSKSQGILINGYRFLSNILPQKSLETLKEYADRLGLDSAITESARDGLIYGGALFVPTLKGDNALTYSMPFRDLLKNGILKKNSLERFWEADRWNALLVPDYNISASDYLIPKSIFVPITGLNISTERASVIRPRQLPYWGTIRQMGWGISDMESWVRPLLGYEMCLASIPIMAQQSSIIFRHIPMDAIIAQNGPEYAAKFANDMAYQMVQMSNIAPKTFNSVGELKAIERNFQGFPELVQLLKQDIGAKAELSDSVIFNTQNGGMNSTTEQETTLKQAETVQKIANKIAQQMQNIVKVLVYSCFGPDSEEAKHADEVRIDFNSPVILTNEERSKAGVTFSTVFGAMIQGGLQPADAIEIGKSFIPDVELPQSVIDKLNEIPDTGETGEGVHELGERLRGITSGALESFGKRIRGEVEQPETPSLLSRITNPITRLFRRES